MYMQDYKNLQIGDEVVTYNGNYTQNGVVIGKSRDTKGMRWISYKWTAPNGEIKTGMKRYLSVYFPMEK